MAKMNESTEKIKESEKEAEVLDPEEVIEVTLMSDPGNIGRTIFCAVNGTAIYVPCGEPIKIKRKYAEVLKRAQREASEAAKRSAVSSSEAANI